MGKLVIFIISILVIVVTFIVTIYGYTIPKYFPSFKTYSILTYTTITSAIFW